MNTDTKYHYLQKQNLQFTLSKRTSCRDLTIQNQLSNTDDSNLGLTKRKNCLETKAPCATEPRPGARPGVICARF